MKIGNKEIEFKEIKYKDSIAVAELSKTEAGKKLILLGTNLTEDEFNELTMKEGLEIQKQINKVNEFEDFQKPQED